MQTERLANTYTHTDRRIDTHKQTDGQAGRQAGKQGCTHKTDRD